MLEVKDLCVNYGAVQALTGISLTVNDGEIVSLIGANGAGKTTTLRTITPKGKAENRRPAPWEEPEDFPVRSRRTYRRSAR